MTVEVRAGDTFPADGTVVDGRSEVDLALLTGESRPVRVEPGTAVWAGTINRAAALKVLVTQAGEASRVGRLLQEVAAGAARRARIVLLADRLAGWFVAVVLLLAVGTWTWWHFVDPSAALDNAIALLIVTCPCALALATPLAVSVAIGRAARQGILIKGGDALESLARPATLYLDKTGTVTEGSFRLASWDGPEWVKPLVVALERHASHPVAAGFLGAWRDVAPPPASDVRQTLGGGVEGTRGRPSRRGGVARVRRRARGRSCGRMRPSGARGAHAGLGRGGRRRRRRSPPSAIPSARRRRRSSRDSRIGAGRSASCRGTLARWWHRWRNRSDWRRVPRGAASRPRASWRKSSGPPATGPVVMVGDGVNDAAAMARATVGIAVRGGAEASLAVADVYLSRPGLAPLDELMAGSERTLRVIRRNIAFSLAYNVAGAALAMGGWINPLIAAILMPASSLTVVLASWRSRTFEPAP